MGNKIRQISKETENAMLRKSAYGLPNRPSESGMKAEDIKKAFYKSLIDSENSLLSELKRVVSEANEILSYLDSSSQEHSKDTNNPHRLTKAQIGLSQVDNTSDANKPISVLQQYELNKKVNKTDIQDNVTSTNADKPLSAYRGKLLDERITSIYDTLVAAINNSYQDSKDYSDGLIAGVIDGAPESLNTLKEIATWIANDETGTTAFANRITNLENSKVDKIEGKQLSSNDFSDAEKTKLNNLSTDAQKNVQADWDMTDVNSDAYIKNKPAIPTALSELTEDNTHRVVSDLEKTAWNNKQNTLSFDDNPTENSDNPVKSSGIKKSLEAKVDKVDGKQLSTNDFTNDDKLKVNNLGTSSSRNVGIQPGNVPLINTNGKIDESIIPAVALTTTYEVDSEERMLNLSAQLGDVCIREDLSKTYILGESGDPTVLSNWKLLRTPTDSVSSVNGMTGNISLSSQDLTDGGDLVHAVEGKGLSSNDFSTVEKNKLKDIESGAQKNVQADWNSTDANSDAFIKNKPTFPNALSAFSQDANHRTVTDAEKNNWNNKGDFNGSFENLTNKPVVNTNNSQTLGTVEAEELSRTNPLKLHKISKTGKYEDLIGHPTFTLDGTTLTIEL